MTLFSDRQATSVRSFLSALDRVRGKKLLWFRGQNNASWRLIPGLMRPPFSVGQEATLIKRFRQNAFSLVPASERSDWDWLLLMQHWGVPTRLLDWTEDPLAALFFATTSRRRDVLKTDGCVWCLNPTALNRVAIPRETEELPFLESELALREYSPATLANAANERPPAAVLVERKFPRMVAQSAVTTVFHKDKRPLDRIDEEPIVGRIVVPKSAKSGIERELERIGVTRLALFPELDSVAELAMSYLK